MIRHLKSQIPRLPVYSFNDSSETYGFLKNKGIHGRVIYVFSSYLHFIPVDESETFRQLTLNPVKHIDFLKNYEREADSYHFLWVMMQSNIARAIYHVVPDGVFMSKKEAFEKSVGENVNTTVRIYDNRIVIHDRDFPRRIASTMDHADEPVILMINASYFLHGTDAELRNILMSGTVTTDMIILHLESDNTNVTEKERNKLLEFRELFSNRTSVS